MKRILPWALALSLLVGAWFVALITPDDTNNSRAFITQAAIDTRTEGRNIAVTIRDVRATKALSSPDGWRAEATWIVIDLDAEAVVSQYGASLSTATLTIGDRTYRATERPDTEVTMLSAPLVPGIPKTGSLAFQVPDDALTGTATLELAPTSFPVYDSIIAFTFDLDGLLVRREIEITPVEWSGS